jgi:hypothetical protein
MTKNKEDIFIYPLTVVSDRYCGVYSRAAWTAWNRDPDCVPEEIYGGDDECMIYWDEEYNHEYDLVGFGDTPQNAIDDLATKIKNKQKSSH